MRGLPATATGSKSSFFCDRGFSSGEVVLAPPRMALLVDLGKVKPGQMDGSDRFSYEICLDGPHSFF